MSKLLVHRILHRVFRYCWLWIHIISRMWQMLRAFDYTEPPQYSGHGSSVLGTERCQMIVKIPACPAHLEWDS